MRRKLFLDMDGVLADFDGGVLKHTGKAPKGHGDQNLWTTIKTIKNFWLNLHMMPDAKKLWAHIKDLEHRVELKILTTPPSSDLERAMEEKIKWVHKHLGKIPVLFSEGGDKSVHASPTAVLVDDWSKNTKAWAAAGGIAVKHENALDTIEQLKALGL